MINAVNTAKEIKKTVKIKWDDGYRKTFGEFKLENKKLGDLFVKIENIKDRFGSPVESRFKTSVKNSYGKELGHEIFSLEPDSGYMFGFDILVNNSEYRQKFKLGEILRLVSTAEMVKNKVEKFSLVSKAEAIWFHSKYKFKPDIVRFNERDNVLKTIACDNHPSLKELSQQAQILIEKLKTEQNSLIQRELTQKTSMLTEQYINRIFDHKLPLKEHQFDYLFDMKLTAKDVSENKDFFNRKFESHGIDFRI